MRIVAGKLGGLIFDSPNGNKTHPMSEKMRGALFNVLGDIEGLSVFDAYGGSGAIAFEAISRGAASAVICEIDKNAIKTIEKNIEKLKVGDKVKLIKRNSAIWCEENPTQIFDIVIVDPPYDQVKKSQIIKIAGSVKPGGIYVLSLPPKVTIDLENFTPELNKNYGDSKLVFYRKII